MLAPTVSARTIVLVMKQHLMMMTPGGGVRSCLGGALAMNANARIWLRLADLSRVRCGFHFLFWGLHRRAPALTAHPARGLGALTVKSNPSLL